MNAEARKTRMVNCPRCGTATPWSEANAYRPFCSERCKLIDLGEWLAPFLPIRNGVQIILKLLRENGKTTAQLAHQGVYQQTMAGRLAQMLRIRLDSAFDCVPEISANKYALNVRFTSAVGAQRRTSIDDVKFELTFCNL